jgi:hypothetical protein
MTKRTRDIGASVRTRLMNLARERGQVFDLLLTRYALERLLYRLSISQHRDRFVLKGAMLVTTWFDDRTGRREIWICWDSASRRPSPCLRPGKKYA